MLYVKPLYNGITPVRQGRWPAGRLRVALLAGMILLASPLQAHGQVDLTAGLLGHWLFEEGTGITAADSSGRGHSGTLQGDASWRTDDESSAVLFGGTNGYVSVPDHADFVIGTQSFSMSAWVMIEAFGTTGYEGIVQYGSLFSNGYGFARYSTTSAVRFSVGVANPQNSVPVWSACVLDANTWYHLAGIRINNGSTETLQIYVDGELFDSRSGLALSNVSGGGPFYFGRQNDGRYIDGSIDDVRLYNRVLNVAEIAALADPANAPTPPPPPPPPPPENHAPAISMDPMVGLTLPTAQTTLSALVHDDGLPAAPGAVALSWRVARGPAGVVIQNPAAASTTVTFPGAGAYDLALTANDGELKTTAEVKVVVEAAPSYAGTVYYVDSATGNDENNGTSPSSPWKTVAKVNATSFTPGSAILFKRGQVWREYLQPASGAEGSPLTYGAYGSGGPPIITAADNITDSEQFQWTAATSGTHEYYLEAAGGGAPELAETPSGVWMNGTFLVKGTAGSLGDHQWAWNGSTVYLRDDSGDPDATGVLIEASQRIAACGVYGRSYVTLDGLRFKHNNIAWRSVLHLDAATHCVIRNCVVEESYTFSVFFLIRSEDNEIENCIVRNNRGTSGNTFKFEMSHRNTIRHCLAYGNGNDMGDSISVLWSSDNLFEYNEVHGPAENGIYVRAYTGAHTGDPYSERNNIRYNYLHHIDGIGIQCRDGAIDTRVTHNILIDNDGPGIQSDGLNGRGASGTLIANNFIFNTGGANGMHIFAAEGQNFGVVVKNNIIISENGDCLMIDQASVDSGAVSDYNCFYKYGSSGAFLIFAGASRALPAFQSASGQDLHSIAVNPNIATWPPYYAKDAKLSSSSPCVNAGTFLGLTEDFFGVTVPFGGGVDMGASEYAGGGDDTTAPVITILGDNPAFVAEGQVYSDAEAVATDDVDGDVSDQIMTQNNVNTAVVGTYTVTYNVTDSAGNAAPTAVRTVNVTAVDTIPPVITLSGVNPAELPAGADYSDAGATASDDVDGDLTAQIVIVNNVNTAVPGTYSVTYNVSDAAGNAAPQATRTVVVLATAAPVITLVGEPSVTIECGGSYADAGATAMDEEDGDLTPSIVVNNPVDPDTPDTYTVTYNVSDSQGNAAPELTRSVVVHDTTPPDITLTGAASITIECGNPYTDAGASASDTCDAALGAVAIDDSAVNTSVAATYTVNFSATDAAGNTATATRTVVVQGDCGPDLEAGLEGHWTFDEGTGPTASDASGNNNGGTLLNGASWGAGGTLVLDGVDDYVSVSDDASLVMGTDDFSVAAWVKFEGWSASGYEAVVGYGSTFGNSYGLVRYSTASAMRFGARDVANFNTAPAWGSCPVETGVWYHLAGVRVNRGTTEDLQLYVNGELHTQRTNLPLTNILGGYPLYLGRDSGTRYVNGSLDDVRVYRRALTFEEVQTLASMLPGDVGGEGEGEGEGEPPDTTPPVIVLLGDSAAFVECGSLYADAGATAMDGVDGDLTPSLVVDDPVDTTTPGVYTVTYSVSDASGNAATPVTRSVTVEDTAAPILTLAGAATILLGVGDAYTDPGATATDVCADDLTASIAVNNPVNTAAPAAFLVTYDVSDPSGNAASQVAREVIVQDTQAPIITLLGSPAVFAECGTVYTDLGATAVDNAQGDLTPSIVVNNPVDTTTLGVYTVTYDVSDASGNAAAQVTRVVTVSDTEAPVITLLGESTVTLRQGDAYTDAGATAADTCGGDLTPAITVNNPVDTSVVGAYTVTYTVSDSSGNAASQAMRIVTVSQPGAPVITLLGSAAVTVQCGAAYTDAGATAVDDAGGDLSPNIVVDNPVDTSTVGLYTVTYDVADSVGIPAVQVSRTVTVSDTEPPLVTLQGEASVAVAQGTSYSDAGATATDTCSGDLTPSIVVNNPVLTDTPGVYTVTYDVADAEGNAAAQVTRTVTVTAAGTPVITLLGSAFVTVECGTTYADAGASADDGSGGDLTPSIVVNNPVDPSTAGVYSVTYDVSDAYGNAAEQVARTVTVSDSTLPVITLNGEPTVTIDCGDNYTEAGAVATDSCDTSLTTVTADASGVDTRAPGSYKVDYAAVDASGNRATATRTVVVLDNCSDEGGIEEGLVGHWRFEAKSAETAPDSSANSNDGTLMNGASLPDGTLHLDGLDDYVVVEDDPTLVPGTDSFTLAAWIKVDAWGKTGYEGIIQYGDVFSAGYGIARYAKSHSLRFSVRDSANFNSVPEFATFVAQKKTWYHLAGVRVNRGTTEDLLFYVNGQLNASVTGLPLTDLEGGQSLYFGRQPGDRLFFGGSVDDLRIYKRALSLEEIQTLAGLDSEAPLLTLLGASSVTIDCGASYSDAGATAQDDLDGDLTASIVTVNPVNTSAPGVYHVTYDVADSSGNSAVQIKRTVTVRDNCGFDLAGHWLFAEGSGATTADSSGHHNDGSLVNRVSWGDGVLHLDGIGAHVAVQDNPALAMGTNDFSVSVWVKVNAWGAAGYDGIVQYGSVFGNGYGFVRYSTTNNVRFGVRDAKSFNCVPEWAGLPLNPGEWVHLVGVRLNRGTTEDIRVYLNGALHAERTGLPLTNIEGGSPLYFGRQVEDRYLNGSIGDLRIFRRALEQGEIEALTDASPKALEEPEPAAMSTRDRRFMTELMDAILEGDGAERALAVEEALTKARQDLYEPVVPFTKAGEAREAQTGSVLAIRLRHQDGIEPGSITVPMPGYTEDQFELEWLPVQEGSLSDLWVLIRPREGWFLGDAITVTVHANTTAGEPVEPVTETFAIESEEAYEIRLAAASKAMWQPQYGEDFVADALDLTAESNDEVVLTRAEGEVVSSPPAEAVGLPFKIGPEKVYDKAQRVWLAVPRSIDPTKVWLYYYTHGADFGWYPAEAVEGWLVPDSYLELQTDGPTYLGFLVRHAGIAQLAAVPADADGMPLISGIGAIASSVSPPRRAPWIVPLLMALLFTVATALLTVQYRKRIFVRTALLLQTEAGPMFGMVCWSGYYKDKDGVWHEDRRKIPDRRLRTKAAPAVMEMRKTIRRAMDRQIAEIAAYSAE